MRLKTVGGGEGGQGCRGNGQPHLVRRGAHGGPAGMLGLCFDVGSFVLGWSGVITCQPLSGEPWDGRVALPFHISSSCWRNAARAGPVGSASQASGLG